MFRVQALMLCFLSQNRKKTELSEQEKRSQQEVVNGGRGVRKPQQKSSIQLTMQHSSHTPLYLDFIAKMSAQF